MQKRTALIGLSLAGAMVFGGTATSVAGQMITGKQIKNHTIGAIDLKPKVKAKRPRDCRHPRR